MAIRTRRAVSFLAFLLLGGSPQPPLTLNSRISVEEEEEEEEEEENSLKI